jgi:phytoene dehydrogenase-like protein
VEGRHRPGGRVYTQKLQGGDLQAVADLGGSIITGIDGNPLAILAKQLRIPMHVIRTECPLYLPNGAQVPAAADAAVERQFNQLLDDCATWRESAASLADHIRLSSALDTFRAMRYGPPATL